MTDQPIVVSENGAGTQIMSGVRSLVTAGVSWAVGKGYFDAATGSQVVSALVIILPLVWSQVATHLKHQKLVTTAQYAPDYVAQVK